MIQDNVLFRPVEAEVPESVAQRSLRVGEAMKPLSRLLSMSVPVV